MGVVLVHYVYGCCCCCVVVVLFALLSFGCRHEKCAQVLTNDMSIFHVVTTVDSDPRAAYFRQMEVLLWLCWRCVCVGGERGSWSVPS